MENSIVYISRADDILTFARLASEVDEPGVNVYKGDMVFDGGSLIGLTAIDMSNGIKVEYPKNAVEFKKFIKTKIVKEEL